MFVYVVVYGHAYAKAHIHLESAHSITCTHLWVHVPMCVFACCRTLIIMYRVCFRYVFISECTKKFLFLVIPSNCATFEYLRWKSINECNNTNNNTNNNNTNNNNNNTNNNNTNNNNNKQVYLQFHRVGFTYYIVHTSI